MTLRHALAVAALSAAIHFVPSAADASSTVTLVAPFNRTVMGDGVTTLRARVTNTSASPIDEVEFRFNNTGSGCDNNYDFPIEQQVTTPVGWSANLANANRVVFSADSSADEIPNGSSLDFDLRVTGNGGTAIPAATVNQTDCFQLIDVQHANGSSDPDPGVTWTRHGFSLVLEAVPSSSTVGGTVTLRYLVANRTSSAVAKNVVSSPAAPVTVPVGSATGPAGTTPTPLSLVGGASGETSWTGTIQAAGSPAFVFEAAVSSSTSGTTTSPTVTSNTISVGAFTSQLAIVPDEWISTTAQTFTLENTVKNNGTLALGNVRPSAAPATRSATTDMVFTGTGAVTKVSGPFPASVSSLAPGQSVTFRWTYTSSGTPPDTLRFQGGAIANGTPNVTGLAVSNTVELGWYSFNVIPGSVSRGELGTINFQIGQAIGIPITSTLQLDFPVGFSVLTATPPAGYTASISGGSRQVTYTPTTGQWDSGGTVDLGVAFSAVGVPAPTTDTYYLIDFRIGTNVLTRIPLLVTSQRLSISASPASIAADGSSTSTVTANLKNSLGTNVSGATVNFDTTHGTLSALSAVTNGSGNAVVTLTSPFSATTITGTVSANRFSATDATSVTFTGVTATPNLLYVGGSLFPKNIAPNTSYAFTVWVDNTGDQPITLATGTTTFNFSCLSPLGATLNFAANLASQTTINAGTGGPLTFASTAVPNCDDTPTQSVFPSFTYNPTRTVGDTLNIMTSPVFASVVDLDVEADGDGARLTWRTELEYDNAGFRVLRADGAGEPEYVGEFVEASGEMWGDYEAFDAGPLGDGLHAWWVEDVGLDGTTTRHGPVFLGYEPCCGSGGSADSVPVAGVLGARGAGDAVWNDPLDDGSVRVVSRDDDAIVYEIVPPAYTVESVPFPVALHDRVRIPGWSALQEAGQPDLPVRAVDVSLPAGMRATLEILDVDDTQVYGLSPTYDIADVPVPDPAIASRPAPFALQRRSHATTFPHDVADLAVLGSMGSRSLTALLVTPLRFDAATGVLHSATRIVARVSFRAAPASSVAEPESAAMAAQAAIVKGPALRVTATRPGLVRVPLAEIAAAGVAAETAAVWRRGERIPARIEGAELVFATGVLPESAWSRESRFWIAAGGALPMGRVDAPAVAPAVDVTLRTMHAEADTWFAPLSIQGDAEDRWFWTRIFTGGPLTSAVTITVPAVETASEAMLSLELKGMWDDAGSAGPEHAVRVRLNGADLGLVVLSDYERVHTGALAVPAGVLAVGENTLEISSESAAVTSVALDSVDLTWTAPADALGADELAILAPASGVVTAGGFAAPVEWAVDETARVLLAAASEPDGLGGFRASVTAEAGHAIRFIANGAAPPATWTAHAPVDVLANETGADYVVIAASELADAAAGFAAYRETPAGGSMRTAVVDIADLYDRFTFGDVDPSAARTFLARVRATWPAPAPRYVLLAGDSDADPLDHLGTGVASAILLSERLDTEVLNVASDSRTAAFVGGDAIPDVALGRIPARDAADLEAALAKTIAYESAPRDGWHERETLFSDDDLPEFATVREELAAMLPLLMTAESIGAESLGDDAARDSLLASLGGGSALATYVGHGGVTTLGAEPYLSSSDDLAVSGGRHPIVLAADCMNAYFDHPYFDALSEELVRAPNAGAVAFFGSSAVTRNEGHRDLALAFHHAFWREPDLRLGDVAMRAYASVAWRADAPDLIGSFTLLGDPALEPNVDGTPIAVARLVSVGPGSATLSASESRDPEGAPLAHRWELLEGVATLEGESSETVVVRGEPGFVRMRLRVADAHRASAPDEIVVELRANPADGGGENGGFFGCSVALPARSTGSLTPLLALAGLAFALCRRRC